MMMVLPKWKITNTFSNGDITIYYISDNFLSNVLRKVSEVDWGFGNAPNSIEIEKVK